MCCLVLPVNLWECHVADFKLGDIRVANGTSFLLLMTTAHVKVVNAPHPTSLTSSAGRQRKILSLPLPGISLPFAIIEIEQNIPTDSTCPRGGKSLVLKIFQLNSLL